jgi:catechol 2,3-dioxygenase-like lactoylglutathione lyase family enzyme
MPSLDHVAICPADLAAALHFYRDGVGLDVLFDVTFDANFEALLGVPTEHPHIVFLGNREHPDAGRIELIDLGTGDLPDGRTAAGLPHRGTCLVSFHVSVDETLQRLAELGLGGPPRRFAGPHGLAAVVVDPDGVMVEFVSQPVAY